MSQDTTELIALLRRDADANALHREAADALERQAAEIETLRRQYAASCTLSHEHFMRGLDATVAHDAKIDAMIHDIGNLMTTCEGLITENESLRTKLDESVTAADGEAGKE